MRLAVEWPNPEEPREEEKLQALQDLGFEPRDDASDVVLELELELEGEDGLLSSSLDKLLEVMQVLVLTDLELCFWPPVCSQDEARCALRQLSCAKRRAALAAQRVLRRVSPALALQCQPPCPEQQEPCAVAGGCQLGAKDVFAHTSLRACEIPGRGLGLMVTADVECGVELLRVPEEQLLNIYSALRSEHFGGTARRMLELGLHLEAVTMLFAILERRRGGESQWAALLARAPQLSEDPLPLTWPSEAVEELGGELASLVQESLRSLWELSREVAQTCEQLGINLKVSFDDLLWARCLFDSRAVSVEMQVEGLSVVQFPARVVCLAPEVDLLNHHQHGVCAPPFFDAERRQLIVKLAAKAAAGGEVCLSYGPLQSWELLLYYGFCPEENPHDRMVISVDLPDSEKEVVLQLHGIPTEVALRPAVEEGVGWCSLGCLPPQLLRCFRVLLGDIGALDLDAPPGEGGMLDLDLQCLEAMEDMLQSVLPEGQPSAAGWWRLFGQRIEAFRRTQRRLVTDNLQQLERLRRLNPAKRPRLQ